MSDYFKNFKVNRELIAPLDDTDGRLNLYDPDNPDLNLFNMVDDELIRLAGSPIWLYMYYRTEEVYDDVYMEQKGKAISKEPIRIIGHYDPKIVEQPLTEFGIELANDQIFIFNKSYVENKIGRSLISHDVIAPDFQNQRYEIFEVQEEDFSGYGVYHLVCSAKLLRDDPQIQDTPLNNPDTKIGEVGDYED